MRQRKLRYTQQEKRETKWARSSYDQKSVKLFRYIDHVKKKKNKRAHKSERNSTQVIDKKSSIQ